MNDLDFLVIRKIRSGDRAAFGELVRRHQPKAMTLALRMLKSREDAEEALQDAFLRVFRSLDSFAGTSNFSTWFYRIVYNVCASALEKRGTAIFSSLDDDEEMLPALHYSSTNSSPEEIYDDRETESIIHKEIERLPVEYASVLTLFFVQQLRYDEITSVTGMPIGTVKTRLFRGRIMLREALKSSYNFQSIQP